MDFRKAHLRGARRFQPGGPCFVLNGARPRSNTKAFYLIRMPGIAPESGASR